MSVDPTIFRSYDVRGLVETQLTDETVELLGKAYGTMARRNGARRVSIGRDCRDSSPRINSALIKGITSTGVSEPLTMDTFRAWQAGKPSAGACAKPGGCCGSRQLVGVWAVCLSGLCTSTL